MFKEIELAQLRNPELEYTSLINKLNDMLDHYRTLINMRSTINKRRAAGMEDEKETDTPTNPDVPVSPADEPEDDTGKL